MSQSLTKNYVHIVFSTKYRQPLIKEEIESELFSYMAGICNNLNCTVQQVGGYLDHVHILCLVSPKLQLSKLLEQVKSRSSKWIKTKGTDFQNFYWQGGYGAFSVRPDETDRVISYISNQKQHHQKVNFQGEYRSILTRFKVDYDERYVWD